jgi:hypothetical protein
MDEDPFEAAYQPRAYTVDEIRDQLINSVWSSIHFWSNPEVAPEYSISQRLSGLAHSILAILDGCSAGLPAFKLVVDPHPDDEEFHREEGENWYPADAVIEDTLHEHLYRADLRRDR